MICDGFEPGSWELNDGVVNIRSMLRPWFPKPHEMEKKSTSRHQSISILSAPAPASSSSSSLPNTSVLLRCESHVSIEGFRDTDDTNQQSHETKRFEKGRWYVYRVDSNHLAGTYWDRNAAELYQSVFTLIRNEYERQEEIPVALPENNHIKRNTTGKKLEECETMSAYPIETKTTSIMTGAPKVAPFR